MLAVRDIVLFLLVHQGADRVERGIKTIVFGLIMRAIKTIDVDDIWRALGPWGWYQRKQLVSYLLCCGSWAIHMLSIVFIGYRPSYRCKPSPNDTLSVNETETWYEYGQCSVKKYSNTTDGVVVTETGCDNGFEYDIPADQSFVTEWNLFCESEELAELTQALMTVGMAIGAFVFPSLSDRFGRKIAMAISYVSLFGIVLGTSFCRSYTVFIVLRILTGAMIQGGLAGTSLALETFPTEDRAYTEPLALVVWTSSICVMSPIAYALRNYSWRYLQLTYALMVSWSVAQWWIQDESLRWLIANGKLEDARKVIRKACKWNKKDYATVMAAGGFYDEELDKETVRLTSNNGNVINDVHSSKGNIQESDVKSELLINGTENKNYIITEQVSSKVVVEKYTAIDLFKNPRILRVSLIIWFTWLTDSLTYYGLFLISSDLYGDRYINFLLSALCEYPAVPFELYAFTRLGRPFTCMLCHAIAARGIILATIFIMLAGESTSMMAAATAFTLIGKLGISAAFSTNYILSPEIYPTNLRSTGIGVAAVVGKIGAIIAPFSRNLAEKALWAPGAIFAVCCVGVVIGMFFVPETSGVELPQTMNELSVYYTNNKFTVRREVSKEKGVYEKKMILEDGETK